MNPPDIPLPATTRPRVPGTLALALSLIAVAVVGAPALHAEPQPITLANTLRLAGASNLVVAVARERTREAHARLDEDRQRLFPWVSPGVGYRRHDGNLQDVVGHVADVSKQSGTAAVGVQAQLDLGDSVYRVLASRQHARAAEADESARRRDVLLAAATAHLALAQAHAALDVAAESVRIADDFRRQVRQAAEAGIATPGDLQRAEVALGRNQSSQVAALERARLAAARLALLLRLPPATELRPALDEFVPTLLFPTNTPLDTLVAAASVRRPETRREDARVAAARDDRDATTRGPWIPGIGAQASFGGLAGGRNGGFGNADDFQDYGVSLGWRIGPGGIGDRARTRSAEARLRQVELGRELQRDAIVGEVVEARVRVDGAVARLEAAQRNVGNAVRLLETTRARREFGVAAVLEAVDAEREWTRARFELLSAIADHNRAQWELWHATGDEALPRP